MALGFSYGKTTSESSNDRPCKKLVVCLVANAVVSMRQESTDAWAVYCLLYSHIMLPTTQSRSEQDINAFFTFLSTSKCLHSCMVAVIA